MLAFRACYFERSFAFWYAKRLSAVVAGEIDRGGRIFFHRLVHRVTVLAFPGILVSVEQAFEFLVLLCSRNRVCREHSIDAISEKGVAQDGADDIWQNDIDACEDDGGSETPAS